MTSKESRAPEENPVYRAVSVARELDLGSQEFLEREFEIYELLREHLPICRMEGRAAAGGAQSGSAWFMSRYDDVAWALRHPETFSSQAGQSPGRPWIPQQIDPPEHTEYRRIMNPWFSPEAMAAMEPHIQQFASELLDTMLAKDEFDFVEEFANPFPTIIFCQLMGFPLEDHAKFMRWKDVIIHGAVEGEAEKLGLAEEGAKIDLGAVRQAQIQVAMEVYGYFGALIAERRKNPQDDLVTKLIDAKYEDTRPLTDEELLDTLFLFMLGGLDTVTAALGLIVLYLAEHPDKRREFTALMDDPQRAYLAVEELMRVQAMVSVPRRVTGDCPYKGLEFRKDDAVVLSIPSANRDPSVFPDPDEVLYDRHPNPHMAFALGPHRCLGMHLARRELRIALEELHRRMPDYHVKPDETPKLYGGLKGVSYLPLVQG